MAHGGGVEVVANGEVGEGQHGGLSKWVLTLGLKASRGWSAYWGESRRCANFAQSPASARDMGGAGRPQRDALGLPAALCL